MGGGGSSHEIIFFDSEIVLTNTKLSSLQKKVSCEIFSFHYHEVMSFKNLYKKKFRKKKYWFHWVEIWIKFFQFRTNRLNWIFYLFYLWFQRERPYISIIFYFWLIIRDFRLSARLKLEFMRRHIPSKVKTILFKCCLIMLLQIIFLQPVYWSYQHYDFN